MAELIQGIGHAMDLKWVIEGKAETGTLCTVQGLMRQLGDTYAALATLTIGVQTFLMLWWLQYLKRTTSAIVMGVELIFVILIVGIPFGVYTQSGERFYATPIPYWCWIGKDFFSLRVVGEYIWFWLTLTTSIALYIPLLLLHWGVIKPGTSWYSPNGDNRSMNLPVAVHPEAPPNTRLGAISRKDKRLWFIILYPILYCVLILPLTIVRFVGFREELKTSETHHRAASALTVMIIYSLGGVFDAALYLLTRNNVFQSDSRGEPHAPVIKMTMITGGHESQ